jgi:hypothetical protein
MTKGLECVLAHLLGLMSNTLGLKAKGKRKREEEKSESILKWLSAYKNEIRGKTGLIELKGFSDCLNT